MESFAAAAASGFLLGGSLIVAIGAQNAFVLRMGLARRHVFVICLLCSLSDALLILAGVAGMGAAVSAHPFLLRFVAWIGAAFLFAYAAMAARRAFDPGRLDPRGNISVRLWPAVAQCLAFTWLNPHVYLDTVVLVGGFAATLESVSRPAFAVGAILASFVWFFGVGYGASLLAPIFALPLAWRILDGVIAVAMVALGLSLLM